MKPFDRIKQARSWLSNDVFPLWTERGIHPENGSFIESLNSKGQPTKTSQRSMVQARQIFSYTEAVKMRILTSNEVIPLIQKSTNFLIQKYSLPSGGFIHSINPQGQPEALQTELYNQAFVIFSLARAYEMIPQENIKATAKKLLKYLETERQAPGGGFTEIKNDQICYQSNPHMHLFEAVIEWLKVSSDPEWKQTAQDIFDLCTQKFIDPKVGVVCEFFEAGWTPIKENSRFVFEPGHQYEWAWLMIEFKKATGFDVGPFPWQIYQMAEKHGLDDSKKWVLDEIWSDFSVKKKSSRFWPQTERIKAAVSLGLRSPMVDQASFAKAADQSMDTLWKYLEVRGKGLWTDTKFEDGTFDQNPSKASSLYHIIKAISEYESKRPLLKAP